MPFMSFRSLQKLPAYIHRRCAFTSAEDCCNPLSHLGGNRRYSNADIQRLQRIAELAEMGMNLEGIRQVLELESEVARLSNEVVRLHQELAQAITDTGRRGRYELVPLRQAIAVFGKKPSIFEEEE